VGQRAGGRGSGQTMYIHVSKCKNNKIKEREKIKAKDSLLLEGKNKKSSIPTHGPECRLGGHHSKSLSAALSPFISRVSHSLLIMRTGSVFIKHQNLTNAEFHLNLQRQFYRFLEIRKKIRSERDFMCIKFT
jgi:hypothetical protein